MAEDIAPKTSMRPKERPSTRLSLDDINKIERVVNAEAKGEGVEGRNAVRGVILNRLRSGRFGSTVDEVLNDEFEPIRKYGSADNIPIEEDVLDNQVAEFADYIQLGDDASQGSSFFLNKKLAEKRGTDFGGEDPLVIGEHTFYKSYEGQEPVRDINFSHNVEIDYGDVGMAKGGLTMDRQMRTFMAEGGLKDDGMNIDPVSGNEIPPGSMAEEVRDDISAQLSEGEYVVPADVVKYFGVKFFEELRSEAKAGLGQMEANGRIGGEPVPAGGPRGGGNMMNDVTGGLTVEEMAQLEAVMTQGAGGMSMAVGGVVPQQYGMPMAQPQYNTGMMQQGMQVGGMVKGYGKGGLEQEMETVQSYNTFDPSDYSLGYSFRPQEQKQTFVLLYGPNGEVVSLMLPRDQAEFQRLAAQGYTTEQPGLTKDKAEEDKKPEDNYGGLADGGQEGPFGGTGDALAGLNDVNGDGKVDFGDTFLGDLLGLDGKIGVQGPGLKDSLQGARRGGGKGKGKGKGTPASTPSAGFESRDTDSIGGGDFSGSGISMGEDFSGDGRGDTGTAPEGYGLGSDRGGISTAPSTTGMSMGEDFSGDGRGNTSTAPEGFGIDGGGEAPGPDAPGPDAPGPDAPGPDSGNASPDPGVAGAEVGSGENGADAVGPFNKGGLASKRRKPKRNTANMAKGGLASPKKK